MSAAITAAQPGAVDRAPEPRRRAARRVLPGFRLTLTYTLLYLCLIVLIPLSALLFKTFSMTWDQFWFAVSGPRAVASYRLTFGASLFAAVVNLVFGLLLAWVLVRYTFPGKRLVDALVDLPFALPTAVAGISLTAILAENPVAVVERTVAKKGTAEVAKAYLDHLYSEEGQEIAAKHALRPRSQAVLKRHANVFKPVQLFTVQELFGSLGEAQKVHFNDGGQFDKIYSAR